MQNFLLLLHIGFAMFALGPLTGAIMATPRYIRAKNVGVLTYLHRTTRIFGLLTLVVLVSGLVLGGADLAEPYLSVSLTLFVVAAVLVVIIDRDQATAVKALSSEETDDDAKVQTGRIATLSSVVALLWIVILILMIWGEPG